MKIKVDTGELSRLAKALEEILAEVPRSHRKLLRFEARAHTQGDDFRNPAELLIAAALVNQTRYQAVVIPRLKEFRAEYKGIDSIGKLRQLIGSMTDRALYTRVLHFGTGRNPKNYRAPLLRNLTQAFDEYRKVARDATKRSSDYQILRTWAREPNPKEALERANRGRIPGLGPKLVDWLRMYGGDVATVPADVYTIEGMKKLGLGDAGQTAGFVARLFRISRYALDVAFRMRRTE